MASIDLPRPLQDYFAFAETTPTRHGRRFSITLPYLRPDGRLDRLQWWYHLSAAKEKALGDRGPDTLRTEAIGRFSAHIERWLQNTRQDLFGEGAIPCVSAEGNRILGAFPVDPQTSAGMLQSNDDLEPMPTAAEAQDAGIDQPEGFSDGEAESSVTGDVDAGQGNPLPANKTAFG